ncbi:HNH endonuclease [Massilia sp. Leaf139]|uniref:HNH endonuclease n=1 Tax=Massilia sp. Leaf139 TaxID=1736272 RepID=UPI0006F5A0F8|nr:hypothetical protein [Massilia sp. Leaf139]KQQ96131.1 hypothetical protein ASF77_21745 [Massilia sp. Leaf139]
MKLMHRPGAEIDGDQQRFLSQPHKTKRLWAEAKTLWLAEQACAETSRLDRWFALTDYKKSFKGEKPREFGKEVIAALRLHLVGLQKGRCCYCRRWLQNVAHARPVEHVLSRKDYPQFSMQYRNLVVCCRDCNQKKSDANWCDLPHTARHYPKVIDDYFHPRLHVYDTHIRYVRIETNDTVVALYHGLTDQGRHLCREHLKTIAQVDGLVSNNKRVSKAFARLQAASDVRDPSKVRELDAFINELHVAMHRVAGTRRP